MNTMNPGIVCIVGIGAIAAIAAVYAVMNSVLPRR